MSENNEEIRFWGGDNLTGIEKLYHETMMRNELRGGYGAYQVSFAGGNSGISFGGNQMDISTDHSKADKFLKILSTAIDKVGNAIFSKSEMSLIAGKNNENISQKGVAPQVIFGDQLYKVNTVLASEYGQTAINKLYLDEMQTESHHIATAIQGMKNPAAKAFYSTPTGKALLFDYHNQFYLSLKDSPLLYEYIDGRFNGKSRTDFLTGQQIVAPIDSYTIEEHAGFIHSTKQWAINPQDCERRFNNILQVIEEYEDILSEDSSSKNPLAADTNFSLSWHDEDSVWQGEFEIHFKKSSFPPHEIIFMVDIVDNTFYYDTEGDRLFFAHKEYPGEGWVGANNVLRPYSKSPARLEYYTSVWLKENPDIGFINALYDIAQGSEVDILY